MISFLFVIVACDIDDDEEENEIFEEVYDWNDYIDANLHYANNSQDLPPRSKYAFVSSYSNDLAPSFDYIQMLTVLGHSLKMFNPTIDRVVIVREEFRRDAAICRILEKAWTHILFRPVLKWPEQFNPKKLYHAKWFKFQAWTLTQYEKILYIGADTMIFTDLTQAFRWNTPSSAYYMTDYGPKDNGVMFNPDFMLIEPDLLKYVELLETTTKYLKSPGKDDKTLGKDDLAPLNIVYRSEISLYPLAIMHENGGYKHTILGNARDPQFRYIYACGVHFAGKGKPWNRWSAYTEIWKCIGFVFYEKLDLPFKLRNVPINANAIYKMIFDDYVKEGRKFIVLEQEEEEEQGDDFYPEIVHSGTRRVMSMICLITFISLLALKFIIRSHQPLSIFFKNMQNRIDLFIALDETPNMPALIGDYNKKAKKRRRKKKKNLQDTPKINEDIDE